MWFNLIHPLTISSQIYSPPIPYLPNVGTLFSFFKWIESKLCCPEFCVRGLALELGGLTGGYAFKGNGLPAYHQFSIASHSRLGWHFVPSSPFLLGFGLD